LCFQQCGPRAWFGRFICKAFGIPTWGVRQPGHAAMTRWTTTGWEVCLGGGMWKSWWNDQGGLDFLLETQARSACTSELRFLQTTYRLQWLAQYYYKEKIDEVRRNGQYDPNSPWYTLSMIQRQRLVQERSLTNTGSILMFSPPQQDGGKNQLDRMLTHQHLSLKDDVARYDDTSRAIVVPATTCNSAKNVTSMPCFLGGQQLFVSKDAEVEYQITPSWFKECRTGTSDTDTVTFTLTCRVATAHRSEQPIQLLVDGNKTYEIVMPYTMALWNDTDPINIEIDVTENEKPIVMKFQRPQQNFGFAFKSFQLVPQE
jgi:hypothetical protein